MKRTQSSAVVFAILLFGAGAAAGALAHRYYTASSVIASAPSEDFRHRYVRDMTSRLNLTPKQVDALEDVLDRTKSEFRSAHETCRPAIAKIKEEQTSEVKQLLTPAQLPLYDRLLAERERRAKEQDARERKADAAESAARKAHAH